MAINSLDFTFENPGDKVVQEEYNPASSGYKDLFDEKFTSFDADGIVSGGNNALKSEMFDMPIEETPAIAFGYKKNETPLTPKPGRFF